jgi:glycosyltransferase involved in cell wall biosynthesis/Flp pilus assembly protein TadD
METGETYLEKGNAFRAEGKWEEALRCYQKVVELEPENGWTHHHLGDALLNLERYDDAVFAYQNCLKLQPNSTWSYYNLGIVLSRVGRWEEAFTYHQEVEKIDNKFWKSNLLDWKTQHQLGDFWFKQEQWKKATQAYYRAIELNQGSIWSHVNLGRALTQLNQYDEALKILYKAIEIDPNFAWSHYYLGKVLHKLGKTEPASSAFNRATELEPSLTKVSQVSDQMMNISLNSDPHIQETENSELTQFINIEPLFDREFYLSQLSIYQRKSSINPLTHYLEYGWQEYLNPHPLFNTQYYISQAPEVVEAGINPLAHYIEYGWRKNLNPHPLFDTQYYISQNPQLNDETNNPLLHYIWIGGKEKLNPHYLFNTSYYLNQVSFNLSSQTPLEHFLTEGYQNQKSPHYLFSFEYYLSQLQQIGSKIELEKIENDNLLCFYLNGGWKLNINPCRLFDIKFYRQQLHQDNRDIEPLYHYIILEGYKTHSPHPAFDLEYYCSQVTDFKPQYKPAILHFIETPKDKRPTPNPAFDSNHYLDIHEDIRQYNICPNLHFVEHGYSEEHRTLNRFFSEEYIHNLFPDYSFRYLSAKQYYLTQRVYKRRRILLVGHDASRTGAPLILLRLMQDISQLSNVEVFLILGKGGDLLDDFKACGHVYIMKDSEDKSFLESGKHSQAFIQEIQDLLLSFNRHFPDFVICNTAEVRHIGDALASSGIPVFSLIHEMADPYTAQQWKAMYDQSQKVIFPSQFVAERANKKVPISREKLKVRGQGLLRDHFGRFPKESSRRKVRQELGFSADDFVILGCGTMDYRKGIDLFVGVAAKVIRKARKTLSQPTFRFIWVGQYLYGFNNSPSYWAMKEVKREGLEKFIIHVPANNDVEKYFHASDIFLLTSRSDPFPCVVHEAMACSLPVIYFEGAGGAAELVKNEAGVGVPYCDVAAMANAVESLSKNPHLCQTLGKTGDKIIHNQYQFYDYTCEILRMACNELSLDFDRFSIGGIDPQHKRKTSPKAIYFMTPDWGISGVNTFTIHLIKQLNQMGFEAKLLFTNGRFSYTPEDESLMPDVPCVFLQPDTRIPHPQNVWSKLLEFFKHHPPCILIPNYDYTASAISPILPDQVAVVGIAHSDDVEHYEHVYRLGRWWNRIVAVSDFIRDEIIEHNQSFASKTSTIRYGIPVVRELTENDIRQKTTASSGSIRLVYSGRLVYRQKRIERYVELTHLLVESGIDFHLSLLGDGEAYDWIKAELHPFIEAGKVYLPGRVTPAEVSQILEKSDIFLLLSDFEGLPLSMLEAMTQGCIPLVSDMKSGIPEVIEPGKNGFICSKHDLQSFIEVISQLANSPELRYGISQNVFYSVKQHKLRDVDMAATYAEIFKNVFAEINSGTYIRPKSFGYKSSLKGTLPPIWLT